MKFNFTGYTSSLDYIYRYKTHTHRRTQKGFDEMLLKPLDEVLTSVVDVGSLFIYLNNKIFSHSSALMHFSIQGSVTIHFGSNEYEHAVKGSIKKLIKYDTFSPSTLDHLLRNK
jgi:hypothetical protein